MRRRPALEICVEDLAAAKRAVAAGADRLELCLDLAAGGLTPPRELVVAARAATDVPLHVLVRPRAGDFAFDETECRRMKTAVDAAYEAGADGVVLGVLRPDGRVGRERLARLLDRAHPMSVTFHRAMDEVPDPLEALETLVELGVDRVLTSGGAPSVPEGLDVLAELVRAAGDRLVVLPGGGVRSADAARILERTGAWELHGSATTDAGRADPAEVARLAAAVHGRARRAAPR